MGLLDQVLHLLVIELPSEAIHWDDPDFRAVDQHVVVVRML